MLIKHGNNTTLMDDTYKVTKYDIPLFILTIVLTLDINDCSRNQIETAAYIQEPHTVKNGSLHSLCVTIQKLKNCLCNWWALPNTFVYM